MVFESVGKIKKPAIPLSNHSHGDALKLWLRIASCGKPPPLPAQCSHRPLSQRPDWSLIAFFLSQPPMPASASVFVSRSMLLSHRAFAASANDQVGQRVQRRVDLAVLLLVRLDHLGGLEDADVLHAVAGQRTVKERQ